MNNARAIADGPPADIFNRYEILAAAQVEAPQLVRLARALQLRNPALTIPEFWAQLREN